MAIDTDFEDLGGFFRSENGHKMTGREVRNLQSDFEVPQFSETTARGQRATARDKSRGRSEESEPNMENSKHSDGEPKGEIKLNKLDFCKREAFAVQSKASEEGIKNLIKY